MRCLAVLEAKSLRPKLGRISSFWELWEKGLFHTSLLDLEMAVFSLALHIVVFSLFLSCVYISHFYKDTSDAGSGPTLFQYDLVLIISVMILYLFKVNFWGLGLQRMNLGLGDSTQLIMPSFESWLSASGWWEGKRAWRRSTHFLITIPLKWLNIFSHSIGEN